MFAITINFKDPASSE